ncbi:MAG TPA: hypothetical protein DHV96_04305 [Lachnospiraceae bacterium]|nr:hypothetical protein [Lachnospiraceae bacterium]
MFKLDCDGCRSVLYYI